MQCHKPGHRARARYVSALLTAGALLATVAEFGDTGADRPEARAASLDGSTAPAALAVSAALEARTLSAGSASAAPVPATRETLAAQRAQPVERARHVAENSARRQSTHKWRTWRHYHRWHRGWHHWAWGSHPTLSRHNSAEALNHLPAPDNAKAAKAVREALSLLGVPYRWGGTTLAGFDCSGFTQHVWAAAGVKIPRTVRAQARAGKPIPMNKAQPGDLVVFYPTQHHVGIYVGDGLVIDSPHTGSRVRPDPVRSMPVSLVVRVNA